jgi:hypothetical protein
MGNKRPKTKQSRSSLLPLKMLELTLASWETIGHRTLMMARGTCSAMEYARMVHEKAVASRRSSVLLSRSKPPTLSALIEPWHRKATANARRLRRRRR